MYGSFELWNEDVLRKIGLLATGIKVEDFERFHFNTFIGLESYIVDIMSGDQQQWLRERKLEYKNENIISAYQDDVTNKSSIRIISFITSVILISLLNSKYLF